LVVFFCLVIVGFLKTSSGIAKRNNGSLPNSSADIAVTKITQVFGAVFLIVAIGFGTEILAYT